MHNSLCITAWRGLTNPMGRRLNVRFKEDVACFWRAFKNVAIVFSFVVNFVTVMALLALSVPGLRTAFALKIGLLDPLLNDLDSAFVGLGEATIDTTVQIDESIPIEFVLPLDEKLPIGFDLPIEQETTVVLRKAVPLNAPATFTFPGGGGAIHGSVQLSLPVDMALPIRLSMVVPVSQTVPVRLQVPVEQRVPIQMTVPVHIQLGESGLDPVVTELRGAIAPVKYGVGLLPDELGWLP
jgi:hypothetical protein